MLIDPGYEEMLERQGKELCEEVGTKSNKFPMIMWYGTAPRRANYNTIETILRAHLLCILHDPLSFHVNYK